VTGWIYGLPAFARIGYGAAGWIIGFEFKKNQRCWILRKISE